MILKIDFEKACDDSVNWNFSRRSFGQKRVWEALISWIMSTIMNGKVCININRENGPYFRTHRGLR